jgi:hypothetical protein
MYIAEPEKRLHPSRSKIHPVQIAVLLMTTGLVSAISFWNVQPEDTFYTDDR